MGSTGLGVKPGVNISSLPRGGGVEINKAWAMGLTEMAGKPPPSCGGGGASAETEQQLGLQLSLGQSGAHTKISKNIAIAQNTSLADRL